MAHKFVALQVVALVLVLAACAPEPEIVEVEVEKIIEVPTPVSLPESCEIIIDSLATEFGELIESYDEAAAVIESGEATDAATIAILVSATGRLLERAHQWGTLCRAELSAREIE